MTIITGVNSPYILGKASHKTVSEEAQQINEELGIDMISP